MINFEPCDHGVDPARCRFCANAAALAASKRLELEAWDLRRRGEASISVDAARADLLAAERAVVAADEAVRKAAEKRGRLRVAIEVAREMLDSPSFTPERPEAKPLPGQDLAPIVEKPPEIIPENILELGVGDLVILDSATGPIAREVVAVQGETILISRPEEVALARSEGRRPTTIDFKRSAVLKISERAMTPASPRRADLAGRKGGFTTQRKKRAAEKKAEKVPDALVRRIHFGPGGGESLAAILYRAASASGAAVAGPLSASGRPWLTAPLDDALKAIQEQGR